MKKGTETEWLALGEKVKAVRNMLIEAQVLASKMMPLKVYGKLCRAEGWIDDFRNVAENEMWKRGGPKNITVFYGDYDPNFTRNNDILEDYKR